MFYFDGEGRRSLFRGLAGELPRPRNIHNSTWGWATVLRDMDIRGALCSELHTQYADGETAIVEELGICRGAARVDVAVINGQLCGYEIKSEADTLERLPRQAELYNAVFDRVTLVVAKNHLGDALRETPSWWGIWTAAATIGGGVELSSGRPGSPNASVDPRAVVEFLWRDEALALLAARDADRGYRSKRRGDIWDRVCEVYSPTEIRQAVSQALRRRKGT